LRALDSFFTPTPLAEALIASGTVRAPAAIADFAAGDGELLRVAAARWPSGRIFGWDIDPACVARLRGHNDWTIYEHDFLASPMQQMSSAPPAVERKFDLVVLNPPFSCRGNKAWDAKIAGLTVRTSIAMAFVLKAVSCLAPRGQILAILPAGSIHSQKDGWAWDVLRSLCTCDVLSSNGHRTFRRCFPYTINVRITLREKPHPLSVNPRLDSVVAARWSRGNVSISRGNVDIPSLSKHANGHPYGAVPLVHTTDMRNHRATPQLRVDPSPKLRLFQGPTILLPRVGKPRRDKVILYTSRKKIALSNCVLTLHCPDEATSKKLYDTVIAKWKMLEKYYTGTCARYMTLEGLREALARIGYKADLASCVVGQGRRMGQPRWRPRLNRD
jgi:predicted RNA methylase